MRACYHPYNKEALYHVRLFIITLSLLCLLLVLCKDRSLKTICIIAIIADTVFECVFYFRIPILAYLEGKYLIYETKEMLIKHMSSELGSGHAFESVYPKLYPNIKAIDRYRLSFQTRDGKLMVLRAVLGGDAHSRRFRRAEKKKHIYNFEEYELITYGKLTHIIVKWDDCEIIDNGIWNRMAVYEKMSIGPR